MTGMKNIEDDDLNYMDDVEGNIKSTQKGRNKDAENKDDDDEIGELEEDEDLEAEEDSQPEDFSEDEELNDEDKGSNKIYYSLKSNIKINNNYRTDGCD